MNEQTLRRELQLIEGEGPSEDFIRELRATLDDERNQGTDRRFNRDPSTVVDIGRGEGFVERRFVLVRMAAAVALLIGAGALAVALTNQPSEVEVAGSVESIGDAWLRSIVDGDRATFVALHAEDFEADDTLMAFSQDVDLLTPPRITELYFDGFDAFQQAIAVDQDTVNADGCVVITDDRARCRYSATLIGTQDYSFSAAVDLTVADGRISKVAFTEISTTPTDLQASLDGFLEREANDDDRACLLLGFNTIGCGVHESDFMHRYIAFHEAQQS